MEGMDATGAKPADDTHAGPDGPDEKAIADRAAEFHAEREAQLVNRPMADSALLTDPAAAEKMAGVAEAAPRPSGTFSSPVTLRKYRSHKIVSAARIAYVSPLKHDGARDLTVEAVEGEVRVECEPAVFSRYTPEPGDYLICYPPDGYMSLSPRDKFEDGYLLVVPDADLPVETGLDVDQGDHAEPIEPVRPYDGPYPPAQPAYPAALPPSHPFALAEYMHAVEQLQAALVAANVTTTAVVEAGHVVSERRITLRSTLGLE